MLGVMQGENGNFVKVQKSNNLVRGVFFLKRKCLKMSSLYLGIIKKRPLAALVCCYLDRIHCSALMIGTLASGKSAALSACTLTHRDCCPSLPWGSPAKSHTR